VRSNYSTDIEGGRPVQLRYRIAGRLDVPAYLAFVADRARWLDLRGWVQAVDPTRIELVAAGPEALVGALEMACTLGPLDALVHTIEAAEEQGLVPLGFEVRL
jgi:acylphosphatase